MLKTLLAKNEGKTLEFKQNCQPVNKIIKTAVAFANTAGGTIVIGIKDGTKDIIGLDDVLTDEERLSNSFAESISPLLIPEIQTCTWYEKELIVITVPHLVGPYYIKNEGSENGVYIRLGSTNRRADKNIIDQIKQLAQNKVFDEQPNMETGTEDIDFRVASELFAEVGKELTEAKLLSLGLLTNFQNNKIPTNGAVLLFGKDRSDYFPDSIIRCARFKGKTKSKFIDKKEFCECLPKSIKKILNFIEQNTLEGLKIGKTKNKSLPQYPKLVLRESIINAIVHADYSIKGSEIKIAIFDDRIEINNPGCLPFGLTMEVMLSGVSKLRNRVIGRVFRELGLIEQWGSGIGRIIEESKNAGLKDPVFEEIGTSFRVTIYNKLIKEPAIPEWQQEVLTYLKKNKEITTQKASELWDTSDRTARTRMRKLVDDGILAEIGSSRKDPRKVFVLKQ